MDATPSRRGKRLRTGEGLVSLPVEQIVTAYLAGESESSLAKRYGTSRTVIRHRLAHAGIERRGRTAANRLMMATRSPEENRRNAEAAHAAARGGVQPLHRLEQRAIVREQLGWDAGNIGRGEIVVARYLEGLGFSIVPQRAVGIYNVDLAVNESVAIEVYGGGWHLTGRHAQRHPVRRDFLLGAGWSLLVVWAAKEPSPVGLAEVAGAVRGLALEPGYRMVMASGGPVPTHCRRLDADLAVREDRLFEAS